MSLVQNQDQALRALRFAAGQLWEANRGITAAFQVDTGDCLDWNIPAWESLTERQKSLFTSKVAPVLKDIGRLAMAVQAATS